MAEDVVLLEVTAGVATLTLNRPELHNAFDENVIAQLNKTLDAVANRVDVFALVLRGAGKSFSAGGDANWMKRAAGYSEEQNYRDGLVLATMLNKLYMLPQVTIACVHGPAMGGGFGLAACCDIVIAGPEARFALSEVKLGLIPATIGPYVMAAIGPRHARRYFQTGERFDAKRGYEIGLVHEVANDAADMEDKLNWTIGQLRANGPQAMRAAKRLATNLAGGGVAPEVMDATAKLIAKTRAGDEAKEGLSAFLEKRKAGWVKG
jgi:methylglutaconyl-CoA hydratase